jgi:magnesium-transporting ATPase (P-type)
LLLNAFGKQPKFARLYRNGTEVEVPTDRLEKGNIIVVHPGEVAPVDGHDGAAAGDAQLAGSVRQQGRPGQGRAVRPEVRPVISELRQAGILHIAIVSGDHEAPTRQLAQSLGVVTNNVSALAALGNGLLPLRNARRPENGERVNEAAPPEPASGRFRRQSEARPEPTVSSEPDRRETDDSRFGRRRRRHTELPRRIELRTL